MDFEHACRVAELTADWYPYRLDEHGRRQCPTRSEAFTVAEASLAGAKAAETDVEREEALVALLRAVALLVSDRAARDPELPVWARVHRDP